MKWAFYAILNLVFNLFVIVTSPLWALVAAAFKLEYLPGILSYLQTHDENIYGYHMTGVKVPERFIHRFKTAVWWLCRNPGYKFAATVLGFEHEGFKFTNGVDPTKIDFHPKTGTKSVYVKMEDARGNKYWSYRKNLVFGKRYVKVWLGWSYVNNGTPYHMLKIMFNPFLTVPK